MKFEIDENLPVAVAELFRKQGFDANTAYDENLQGADDETILEICDRERRALVTLDLDFGDILSYPPNVHEGLIVLRLHRQDPESVLSILEKLLPVFRSRSPSHQLWVVEEHQIRIRE